MAEMWSPKHTLLRRLSILSRELFTHIAKVPPEPFLTQAECCQPSQRILIGKMLQSLHHFAGLTSAYFLYLGAQSWSPHSRGGPTSA